MRRYPKHDLVVLDLSFIGRRLKLDGGHVTLTLAQHTSTDYCYSIISYVIISIVGYWVITDASARWYLAPII